MIKIIALLAFLLGGLITKAEKISFNVRGHITLLKKSSRITLTVNGITLSSPISGDGSFSFLGRMEAAGEATIRTDSSYNNYIWVEDGEINLKLIEKKIEMRSDIVDLNIVNFSGPDDSYLYYYKTPALMSSIIRSSSKAEYDSLRKITLLQLIDSVIQERPTSLVLPHLIRFFSKNLGEIAVGQRYSNFSLEQQNSKDGERIRIFLEQQSSLKKGSVFGDFIMTDSKERLYEFGRDTATYYLIDFWSSDCIACRTNHSFLLKINEKFKPRGLSIIGISLDTDKEEWLEAVRKDKLPWVNVADLQGYDGPLPQKYHVYGLPFSVLLDKQKKVIAVDLRGDQLLNELDSLFRNVAR